MSKNLTIQSPPTGQCMHKFQMLQLPILLPIKYFIYENTYFLTNFKSPHLAPPKISPRLPPVPSHPASLYLRNAKSKGGEVFVNTPLPWCAVCLFSVFLFVFSDEFTLDIARNKFVRSKLHDERSATACDRTQGC